MTIFYTADPHFWHKNVIEYCKRPWSTVEEMNEGLIANWNSLVRAQDEVYILGDFAFAGAQKVQAITERLNGKLHLIVGNHDFKNFKIHHWSKLGFASADEEKKINIPGLGSVRLSHFPYLGTPHPDLRHLDKRPIDRGDWLFHGHIHNGEGSWKINGRQVNVGVDVWNWFPVAEEDIVHAIQETKA